MRRTLLSLTAAFVLGCVALASPAAASCPPEADPRHFISGGGECLVYAEFGSRTASRVVIVIGGDDVELEPAVRHEDFARSIGGPDIRAIALTRPGYTTRGGLRSSGSDNNRIGLYTTPDIDALADAAKKLIGRSKARQTILVGYSGGANISGVIIGRHPGIFDKAILIGCQCTLTGLSGAMNYAENVPSSTEVIMITGTVDERTPAPHAREYLAVLQPRGIRSRLSLVSGAGHTSQEIWDRAKAVVLSLR